MTKKKVVHYINQFYAGMGGEDTASVGLSVKEGAAGPGAALAKALGPDYEIVKTIVCGDNTIAEHPEAVSYTHLDVYKRQSLYGARRLQRSDGI